MLQADLKTLRLCLLWAVLFPAGSLSFGAEDDLIGRVTVLVRHVHYQKFREKHQVAIGEEFGISDGDISAKVVAFYPDFFIEKGGEAGTRSQEMKNPAVKIRILRGGKKLEEVYAFGKRQHSGISKEAKIYFILLEYELAEGKQAAPKEAENDKE